MRLRLKRVAAGIALGALGSVLVLLAIVSFAAGPYVSALNQLSTSRVAQADVRCDIAVTLNIPVDCHWYITLDNEQEVPTPSWWSPKGGLQEFEESLKAGGPVTVWLDEDGTIYRMVQQGRELISYDEAADRVREGQRGWFWFAMAVAVLSVFVLGLQVISLTIGEGGDPASLLGTAIFVVLVLPALFLLLAFLLGAPLPWEVASLALLAIVSLFLNLRLQVPRHLRTRDWDAWP